MVPGKVGMIVGVHTGGNGNYNYGTFFGDDFTLSEIFGFEKFKEFMNSISEYEPKQKLLAFGGHKWQI